MFSAPPTHTTWLGSPLLALLLLGACDLREPISPLPEEAPPPVSQTLVSSFAIEVDPAGGTFDAVALEAADPDYALQHSIGGAAALLPVTTKHVRVTGVTCDGCSDQDLGNQRLAVSFTVRDATLVGLDFRRAEGGDALAAMLCSNCEVQEALLRGAGVEPLTATLQSRDTFVVELRVAALENRPFTVRFELVAGETQTPTHIAFLFPLGSSIGEINNRGEAIVSMEAGLFLWSAAGGYRPIPNEQWNAMNDRGQLVGTRGDRPNREAIYWPGSGPVQVLPPLSGHRDAHAADINNSGVIVGGADDPAFPAAERTGATVPIVWDKGVARMLPIHPIYQDWYAGLEAISINDLGEVVGQGWTPTTSMSESWRNGEPTGQGGGVDVNNAGLILSTNSDREDWCWYGSGVWSFTGEAWPIGSSTMSVSARALNDHGSVVGSFRYPTGDWDDEDGCPYEAWGPPVPFRWTVGGEIEPLPLPEGATSGSAFAVNELGQITGTVQWGDGTTGFSNRGVIWETVGR